MLLATGVSASTVFICILLSRCHRIGQTKRVLVYRLVTEHSVDHVIVQRAEAKRKLERVVLQDGRFDASHRALTRKVSYC